MFPTVLAIFACFLPSKTSTRMLALHPLVVSCFIQFCKHFYFKTSLDLDSEKKFMKLTEVSNDKTYGYEIKKPIKVGTDETAVGTYLNSIKTQTAIRI